VCSYSPRNIVARSPLSPTLPHSKPHGSTCPSPAVTAGAPESPAVSDVLSRRALNRATLERQLLLRRSPMPVLDAVEHLVGLQAQEPLDPYTGLWSRLEGFRPEQLARLLLERRAVRTALMRSTIHLVSADDCLALRPLLQPVLDAELARHPAYAPALDGVDLEPVLAVARTLLAERPRTAGSCGRRLPSGSPSATRPRSRTPAATVSRSSRCRHGGSGGARHRSRRRRPRRGSDGRSLAGRRSSPWCFATSAPSGPRPSPT
jgi:hypothetical protein